MSVQYFMEFTSGVTYRIPVNDDGKIGQPEILRKWTSEPKKIFSKKKEKVEETLVSNDGEVYL